MNAKGQASNVHELSWMALLKIVLILISVALFIWGVYNFYAQIRGAV